MAGSNSLVENQNAMAFSLCKMGIQLDSKELDYLENIYKQQRKFLAACEDYVKPEIMPAIHFKPL